MSHLLFALQLSPIDANAAVELIDVVTGIEAAHPSTCRPSWLISYRKDTPLIRVHAIEQKLCQHYDSVWLAMAKEYASGWPGGSNALWRSTMRDVAELAKLGELDCAGVLTFEPDCCPLRLDWIDVLDQAYGSRLQPIVGNLHDRGIEEAQHINGNAMWPVTAVSDWPNILQTPAGIAWDFYHRKFFLNYSEDTPFLTQIYRRKNLTKEVFEGIVKGGERPALLHGIKDGSAIEMARRAFVHGTRARAGVRARTVGSEAAPTKSRMQSP
jgi:hypothetical protein